MDDFDQNEILDSSGNEKQRVYASRLQELKRSRSTILTFDIALNSLAMSIKSIMFSFSLQ